MIHTRICDLLGTRHPIVLGGMGSATSALPVPTSHTLDVVAPASKPAAAVPVVIFVHGGGYVREDKTVPGTPFFQNIAAFLGSNWYGGRQHDVWR
jgi:acetyl esterase/lipase